MWYDVAASALTPPLLQVPRRRQRQGDRLLKAHFVGRIGHCCGNSGKLPNRFQATASGAGQNLPSQEASMQKEDDLDSVTSLWIRSFGVN